MQQRDPADVGEPAREVPDRVEEGAERVADRGEGGRGAHPLNGIRCPASIRAGWRPSSRRRRAAATGRAAAARRRRERGPPGPDLVEVVAERLGRVRVQRPDAGVLVAVLVPGGVAVGDRHVVGGVPVGARQVRRAREVRDLERRAAGDDPAAEPVPGALPDRVQDPRAGTTAAVDGGDAAPDDPMGDADELVLLQPWLWTVPDPQPWLNTRHERRLRAGRAPTSRWPRCSPAGRWRTRSSGGSPPTEWATSASPTASSSSTSCRGRWRSARSAERLGVSQQAASKAVADLERRGYVERVDRPGRTGACGTSR